MSSAILYLAIVAIWAFMLVPRWLRRSHAVPLTGAPVIAGTDQAAADLAAETTGGGPPEEVGGDELEQSAPVDEAAAPDLAEDRSAPAPVPAGPRPPGLSRAKVLQARRRLLTTLILLAVAAVSCTALGLTSAWVCVPPAGMLGMYLLLLREAALADAETARWRAQQAHASRQGVREQTEAQAAAHAPQPAAQPGAQPTAQVIDISDRLGDQLYDQYADATMRAVGD